MKSTSLWLAIVLGLVSIVGGILGYTQAGSTASLIGGGVSGVVLLIFAALALRGSFWAYLVVLVVALALLGRFVPAYFREPQIWPSLVMIALASLTFGFGLLGVVLDRFNPRGKGGRASGGSPS